MKERHQGRERMRNRSSSSINTLRSVELMGCETGLLPILPNHVILLVYNNNNFQYQKLLHGSIGPHK